MIKNEEPGTSFANALAILTITLGPSISLLDLPTEILDGIFSRLSQHDQTVCARVNKRLNSLCIPLLWSTIHIQYPHQLQHFHTPAAARARHCGHVKILHLNHGDLFHAFVSHRTRFARCTGVRYLTVCYEPSLGQPGSLFSLTQDQEHDILDLVHQNQCLVAISIESKISYESLLILALTSPRSIREMNFSTVISPETARFVLDNLPEQVQKLTLHQVHYYLPRAEERLPVMIGGRPRHHHALETLGIFGTFPGFEDYIWLPFLTTCGKNLTDLSGNNAHEIVIKTPGLLSQLGVIISDIGAHHFPNKEDSSDQEIANVISLDSGWMTIDLDNCKHVGPKTVEAILGHCTTLESLRLNRCELLTNSDMLAILGKAKKLKNFQTNGIVPRRHDPSPRFLTSIDMTGLRWGSYSLTTFCCPIKVPCPDDDVTAASRQAEWYATLDISREAQRYVYQQLSKLTKLKELRLGDMRGGGRSHRAYLWYCLEMTLASGMDELEGLKQQEILDIRMMNHDLGMAELEWINRCWPRLKCVLGLIPPGTSSDSIIEYWFSHHQPAWTYK